MTRELEEREQRTAQIWAALAALPEEALTSSERWVLVERESARASGDEETFHTSEEVLAYLEAEARAGEVIRTDRKDACIE